MKFVPKLTALMAALTTVISTQAHDGHFHHVHASTNKATALKLVPEKKGPVRAPAPLKEEAKLSGSGFWKFMAVTNNVLPIPEEALPKLRGAHGTIIIDSKTDTLYWGLQNVGWVAFSNKLSKSWIIKGDEAFSRGNLHGADILYKKKGNTPVVAVADNDEGEVYLSDLSFQKAEKLDWPTDGPYKAKGEFHPTDVAFTKEGQIYVTDGYGKGFVMPAGTDPLKYEGVFIGGKELSNTPHGVTLKKDSNSLIISARPEGEIKELSLKNSKWSETFGLPPGSTVCDVDIWGDYALAPCLNGPNNTPGPIYILNLKKKTIVSVIKPKEELGFTEAQHIHDAAWYVVGKGRNQEVYVVFTNWNPGGIGAVKLVNVPDKE
ncbi:MAG: hypothetical protein ACO1QB_12755 [Verrucomicrobiales bacterium]